MDNSKISSIEERRRKQDFLSTEGMKEIKALSVEALAKQKAGTAGGKLGGASNPEQEAKINNFISERLTWMSRFPGLRTHEYWRIRAEFYPYVRIADASDDFFIRGVTMHPRLSEYPMCNDVIRDYFSCRDSIRLLYFFNTCVPMKEQLSSCINNVFIRNHKRTDEKFNENRPEFFDSRREKKLKRMIETVTIGSDGKGKMPD
jgi:hypothetical protein